MAGDRRAPGREEPRPDGRGLRVALVCARFNDEVTCRLLDGAQRGLAAVGVDPVAVTVVWVPGAFEIPLVAKAFAQSGKVDAILGLGCVIRGETTHYETVAGECAAGIQRAQLETGVPIVFGVLTTETVEQAHARSEDAGGHNVGESGAFAAVEMATLVATIRT
ncbi:MAG: 6,7-dimethyl-8-ribityllumazine synthase [Acidimicrobiales bacterium]